MKARYSQDQNYLIRKHRNFLAKFLEVEHFGVDLQLQKSETTERINLPGLAFTTVFEELEQQVQEEI